MKPRDPITWDGKKITAPGIYLNVPMDAYHGDLCAGPSISSSGLRQIETESPKHYFSGSYLNPRHKAEDTKAFALGRAVHMLLLGEAGFAEQFVLRPSEIGGKPWQGNRAECREWVSAQASLGKSVITDDDLSTIRGIAASMQAEPIVQQGLFSGMAEASIVWQDAETGIWLKARPDVYGKGQGYVADLKTIACADAVSCQRSIAEYGYHQQLALCAEGIEAVTGEKIPNDGHLLVFVEKKAPYAVNLKPLDAGAVWYGAAMNRRALRTFAKCIETGEWPGYADSGMTAYLPGWLENRLKADLEAGLLPNPDHITTTKTEDAA